MFNKKLMILAIFIVSLLAVSAVSAADNATDDIVSADNASDVVSIEETIDDIFNVEEECKIEQTVNNDVNCATDDEISVLQNKMDEDFQGKVNESVYANNLDENVIADNPGAYIKIINFEGYLYEGSYPNEEVQFGSTGYFCGYLKCYKDNRLLSSNWYCGVNSAVITSLSSVLANGIYPISVGTYELKMEDEEGNVWATEYVKVIQKPKTTTKKKTTKKKTTKKKTTKKKSSGKKITLKFKNSKSSGKHIKKAYIYAGYGDIYGPYVRTDSHGSLSGIKLIKAKIYFKNKYNGKLKVKTKKLNKWGMSKTKLISGYTPYKVLIFYIKCDLK